MKCKLCDLETSSYQGLAKHVKAKHNMTAKEYYDKYIKLPNTGICICGKETPFLGLQKGYQRHCCARCGQIDMNTKNNLRVNNPQKNIEIKNKTIETCNNLYGGRGYKSKSIQEKSIQTRYDKYGLSNKLIKQKIDNYCKEYDIIYIEKAFKYNNNCGWIDNIEIILYYGQRLIKRSDLDYIKQYKSNKIDENFIIDAIKDVYSGPIKDLYLPKLNIQIKYHSNYDIALESGKDKNYILNQSILYRDKGIRLIHIYEFEDIDTQLYLLKELIKGNDLYDKNDFNKNNLNKNIPISPSLLYIDAKITIYGC